MKNYLVKQKLRCEKKFQNSFLKVSEGIIQIQLLSNSVSVSQLGCFHWFSKLFSGCFLTSVSRFTRDVPIFKDFKTRLAEPVREMLKFSIFHDVQISYISFSFMVLVCLDIEEFYARNL